MRKINTDRLLRVICIILMIICIFVSAFTFMQIRQFRVIIDAHSSNRGEYDNIISMMQEIEYLYNQNYIGEEPNRENIEDLALLGFTAGFNDKYGVYLSPSESKEMLDERKEKLVGIGVEVVYEEDNGYYISKVYDNSPAESVGIQPGSYLTHADGVELTKDNVNTFIDLVRGEVGTTVNVGITSDGVVEYKDIVRQDVKMRSVIDTLLNGVPYIHISSFTEYTDEEFIETIEKYKENHHNFIIDLRNNGGGAADSVINMLDYILPRCKIVEFRGLNDNTQRFMSDSKCIDAKFVILTNNATASASELFSKVLQEKEYALIVGENTYGKGTVLSTFSLSNGGTLTLSTAKYYTESGDELEGVGVKPNIEVKLSEGDRNILYKLAYIDDEQLQEAVKIVKNWNSEK